MIRLQQIVGALADPDHCGHPRMEWRGRHFSCPDCDFEGEMVKLRDVKRRRSPGARSVTKKKRKRGKR